MAEKVRMLGLDLDGTLLNNSRRIAPSDEIKIRELLSRGIYVVPVTGRPKSGITEEVRKLFEDTYIISSNGAVVTDMKTDTDFIRETIDSSTVVKIAGAIGNYDEATCVELFAGGKGFSNERDYRNVKEKFMGTSLESYILKTRNPVKDIISFARESSMGIDAISVMTDSDEKMEWIENELTKFTGIKTALTGPGDLEVFSENAGKGKALLTLALRLGIRMEQVMACGDSGNDIEMLEMAGIAVAMGNAQEKVRKNADFITLTNEEGGVAHAIDRLILNI